MSKLLTITLLLSVITALTNADITSFADSSTFDYRYEMDVDPTTQNLDSLGAEDWFAGTSGGVTAPNNFSGGIASSNSSAATPEVLWRGDFNTGGGGSMWRELVSDGAASDWTLEISVRKDGGTQGSLGWFSIATANLGESNSMRFNFEDDRVSVSDGTTATDYLVGTNFADGSFHTVRIAHDTADNAHYIWVNDVLLNDDLSTPIAGINGSAFVNSTFIGDYTGSVSGDWSVDYMRFDTDALGVVPEQGAFALLAGLAGMCFVALRRR